MSNPSATTRMTKICRQKQSTSFHVCQNEHSDSTLSDYFNAESDSLADSALELESKEKELDILLNATLKERDIYVIRHTYGLGCEELS